MATSPEPASPPGQVSTPGPAVAPPGGWLLRRRLGVTYVIAATLLLVIAGTVAWSLLRLEDAIHTRSDELAPALLSSTQLVSSLVDQETGMRGFLLQGSEEYLIPFNNGRRQEQMYLADLRQRLAGRPDLLARVTTLDERTRAWHTDYADPALAAVRSRGTAAAKQVPLARGKVLFDQVRAASDDLGTALRARTAIARHNVTSAVRFLVTALSIGTAVLIALFTAIAWALRTWVTRPIEQIGRDARTVASGELDHVVEPAGPPDLVALAADVESMRRQLHGELGVAQSARIAVEAQADALARSNRDLEQFAYVASHDLQEPLRKVASFCQLLERRYGDKLDERGTQYIAFAVDGAKRMQQLINDLLAFSRVGRTTENFVEVPLGDLFGRATTTLSLTIESLHGEVTADELPVVRGDPVLLTQLLTNLIGNALKFHSDELPRVHLAVTEQPEHWEFALRDNGIGIDAEYAEKIFVIFQRLHGREVYEGTGIGLALCRKILEFHGGRIWLDADAHPGTTFRFTLPRQAGLTPAVAPVALVGILAATGAGGGTSTGLAPAASEAPPITSTPGGSP
ncbi:sensor histidine kinase [Frankia sp. AgKG'84/4]|uniref:sensor histidine kinase n=1 Tax=Frankia sp. AgKG'84/4 TaxID=573490 RepID=UPI00200C8E07|nr:CHASE3 domain-containing protein [Frankia sp. AgKG'84/4]MCL9795272.1 CHASE3 domain-containing protein [Frankia sp. AgKG'84/4]